MNINKNIMEVRFQEIEFTANNDKSFTVSGYVNKTEQKSNVLGTGKKFIEKIAKGAFKKAIINRNNDIDFLAEHKSDLILASTKNGSLSLTEDEIGLYMEATITPTSWGKDYYELIQSKILQNMSFGFRTVKDSWRSIKPGLYERVIEELELFEVSVVKNPAYSQSTISARGIDVIEEVKVPEKIKEENNEMKKEIKLEKRKTEFGLQDIIRNTEETRDLQTTATGGALIPETVEGSIIKKMEETSSVFSKVRKLKTQSGEIKVARESDSIEAAFVGEGLELTEGNMDFDFVKLGQKRVGSAISLSNQLINDSEIDIESYVGNLLARRTAKVVEKSILVGDKEEEFRGVIHDEDIKSITGDGSADMDTLQDLYLGVHPEFLQDASFIMNRDFFNKVAKSKDGNGHYFLQNGVVNGKLTYTLFGMEVDVTDSLPATTPVVFGNIEEGITMMIKKGAQLQKITADTTNALRGSQLFVYDAYMDSAVTNPQALIKLEVPAA